MSREEEEQQAEERELKKFHMDALARMRELEADSRELAAQHKQLMARRDALPAGHPETAKLTQAIADVSEQQKITNQAMETTSDNWKAAGASITQLRDKRERQNFDSINLRDLPRVREGVACDGNKSHESLTASTRRRSSKIPDSVSQELNQFCASCMVCGRAASDSVRISKAHILNDQGRVLLWLPNDTRNYVALCGTFRQPNTCHDLFDKGAIAFIRKKDADATQWMVLGGTVDTHGKTVTLATRPHRRSMNTRLWLALDGKKLQLARDDDLSGDDLSELPDK